MHWNPYTFALPQLPENKKWYLAVDTADRVREGFCHDQVEVEPDEEKGFVVSPRTNFILWENRIKDVIVMYIWKHFKTITKHKLLVMRYCFRIGLYKQGLLHDLSKYSWPEFRVGCRYYQGNRSPNNAEREAPGVSTSWMHHKGRNKHHYEYWVDSWSGL